MKTFKLLSLTLALIMMLGTVAYADVINQPQINDDTAQVTITGTIEGAVYGDAIGVYILKSGKKVTDLTEITGDKFKEVLAGYTPALTDAKGNYTAILGLGGFDQGDYTVVVASSRLSENAQKSFFFASKTVKADFVAEVKQVVNASGANSTSLKNKLNLTADEKSDTARLLNIGSGDLILTVDEDGLAKVLFSMIKADSSIVEGEPQKFVDAMGIAALIQSLNEGAGDITDSRLALSEEFVATYDKLSDNTKKTFVSDYFKDKGYVSLKEVQDRFCEAVVLATLANAKGWSDYESLIENHGEYIGIDMDDYEDLKSPSKVTDELKNSYTSLDSFVKDVNKAIEDLLDDQKSSGGSGGGGGGGGNVSFGGNVVAPPVSFDSTTSYINGTFADVNKEHWASECIEALVATGAVNGRGDGTFGPDLSVTREEFVKMTVVALGINVDGSTNTSFADVDANAWYAPYITAAEKAGIINGVGEGVFGIGQTVTREQASTILYRAGLKLNKNFASSEEKFNDDGKIADWAKEAVYALKGEGIISGVTSTMFMPSDECTRAQTAKLIYGLSQKE